MQWQKRCKCCKVSRIWWIKERCMAEVGRDVTWLDLCQMLTTLGPDTISLSPPEQLVQVWGDPLVVEGPTEGMGRYLPYSFPFDVWFFIITTTTHSGTAKVQLFLVQLHVMMERTCCVKPEAGSYKAQAVPLQDYSDGFYSNARSSGACRGYPWKVFRVTMGWMSMAQIPSGLRGTPVFVM